MDPALADALPAGEVATETFTVLSADGTPTDVTITITGTNDAPTLTGGAGADTFEDDSVTFDALTQIDDVDNPDDLVVTQTGNGANGSVTINPDGTLTYTPNIDPATGESVYNDMPAGATTTDTFTYTVSDGAGGTVTQTATVTITGTNDGPVAAADVALVGDDAGDTISGNVITGDDTGAGADSDVDTGDTLTITEVQVGDQTVSFSDPSAVQVDDQGNNFVEVEGEQGTLQIYEDGSYTYEKGEGGDVSETLSAGLTGTATPAEVEAAWGGVEVAAFDFGTSIVNGDGAFDMSLADDNVTFTSRGLGVEGTQGGMPAPSQINYDATTGESEALAINLTEEATEVRLQVSNLYETEHGGEQGAWQAFDSDGNLVGSGELDDLTVDYQDSNVGTATIQVVGDDGAPVPFQYIVLTGQDYDDPTGSDAGDFFVRSIEYDTAGDDDLGPDVFTYTVSDESGATDTATLSIGIDPDNGAPVITGDASADILESDVAQQATGQLDIVDPDTGESVFQEQTDSAGEYGSFSIDADGSWTYDLDAAQADTLSDGQVATETFTVLSADGTPTDVTVTITGTNDAPLVGDASADILEDDASVSIDVLSLASDVDANDDLEVSAVTDGANGSVTINPDGSVNYTPNIDPATGESVYNSLSEGETTTDTFTYTISDGEGGTVTGTATVTITGTNDAPVADVIVGGTAEDTLVSGQLTATDVDNPTEELTFSLADDGGPANGTVVVNPDGSYSYTPNDDWSGTDTFTYTIDDGDGGVTTATATVDVEAVADAPTLSATVEEITTSGDDDFPEFDHDLSNVVMYLEDENGDIIKVKVEDFPDNSDGIRDPDDLDFESFVAENYPGSELVAVTVKAGDNANPDYGPGEGQLFILDDSKTESDLPMADHVDDGNSFNFDESLGDFVLEGGSGGDSLFSVNISAELNDPDGSESLSVTVGDVPDGVTFSAGTNNEDGTWTFSPDDLSELEMTVPEGDSVEFDLSISATSTEASNDDSSTVSINLSVDGNQAPEIVGDAEGDMLEDFSATINVLNTAIDPDDDELEVSGVTDGANGTVTINEDGTVTYTPNTDHTGESVFNNLPAGATATDTFTYTISDGAGGTVTGTATVTITGTNDVPTITGDASADILESDVTQQATGQLDIADADTGENSFVEQSASEGDYGNFSVGTDGAWSYDLDAATADTLPAGEVATETFTVTSADGTTTDVTITITGTNDAPTLTGSASGDMLEDDASVTLDVLSLADDVDTGDVLSVGSVTDGENGSVVINSDGTVSYTPNEGAYDDLAAGETATDTFTYVIEDGEGGTVTGTATVTITGTEDTGVILGTPEDDVIVGTDDDDTIEALGGDDTVTGGAGDDTIDGGAGDDVLVGDGGSSGGPGDMYVLSGDYGDNVNILKVSADGSVEVIVTENEIEAATGHGNADMADRGISVDDDGNVFFTDSTSDSILMKPADGGDLQVLATRSDIEDITGSSGADPKALTVGADGNVYVSDDRSDSILRLDPTDGSLQQVVGKSALKDLPGISSVDLDGGIIAAPDGTLYAASDGSPDAIFAINPTTGEASVVASGSPFNDLDVFMTMAPNGDIIVADDHDASTIYRVDPESGEVSVFLSEAEIEAVVGSNVDLEGGISFDADGNFYVADENSDDIFVWNGYDAETGEMDPDSGSLFISESTMQTASGDNIDLEGGIEFGAGGGEEIAGNDTLTGGSGDDTLIGGGGDDSLDGGADDDLLQGGTGADVLDGGAGADVLEGGAGDDTLIFNADGEFGDGHFALNVGGVDTDGTDEWVPVTDMTMSLDDFDGGDGNDTLQMTDGNDALFLDDGGDGPNVSNIETIEAGAGNDVIDLTSDRFDYGDVTLDGGSGDDTLWSSVGDDTLLGGTGNDDLFGGAGDDTLDGGEGQDTAMFSGSYDDYVITIGEEAITVAGPDGTDTLTGIEVLEFAEGSVNVADIGLEPTVTVQAAAGDEDSPIALNIIASVANPLETVDTVTLEGVPGGSTVMVGDAGEDILLEPNADGSYSVPGDQLGSVTLTPPQDFNGPINLTVSATSTEGITSTGQPLPVDVAAVNDAPELYGDGELTLGAGNSATITNEDLQLTDVDDNPEDLTYHLTDGPDHGTLFLDGAELGVDDTFTQEDIDSGLLSYTADEVEVFEHEWAEGTPSWDDAESAGNGGNPIEPLADNFSMPEGAESVTMTFESEGTRQQDTMGWYKIDEDGNPGEAHILWGNTQDDDLDAGESTVELEGLQPGESFGLFIVSDGNREESWLSSAEDDGLSLSFDADGNLQGTDANGNVVDSVGGGNNGGDGNIFHAFGDNPVDGAVHATSGTNDDGGLMIGFENRKIGGRNDGDFDELVVSMNYEGPAAEGETEDSFTFTAEDDDNEEMQEAEATQQQDDGGAYTTTGGEAAFHITIDTTGGGG